MTTISVAHERPELVERIVVMGTVGVTMELPEGLDRVWGYRPTHRDRMRELVELFAADPAVATDDLVDLRFAQSLEPEARASYEAMFPAPRQRWLDDLALGDAALRAIEHDVLLVHGAEDRVVPLASSLRALGLLPRAELHAFGRCGHWVQIEQTRRFIDVVTDFLRSAAQPA